MHTAMQDREERKGTVDMTGINYVQAIADGKRKAIDRSMMLEGEDIQSYIHRMHALGVWRLVMVSGITDWAVYRADDLLRRELPGLDRDREAMMRHYHFYEDRLHMMTKAPDDYLDDIRLKACQRHRRKLEALLKAVCKEYARIGVPCPKACATLCIFTNFIIVAEEAYRAYVRILGDGVARQLPTFAEDAIRRLERSGAAAGRIIGEIDTGRRSSDMTATAVISRMAKGLLESIISPDELNRAAEYANKEYRKAGNG